MWIQTGMFLMMQSWSFYPRVSSAIDFVVPIPAFLFLNAAGSCTGGPETRFMEWESCWRC